MLLQYASCSKMSEHIRLPPWCWLGRGWRGAAHPPRSPQPTVPPTYTDYTLVLDGKSYHLQFQIKACSSAYGKYH